jgi:hypothetical protein
MRSSPERGPHAFQNGGLSRAYKSRRRNRAGMRGPGRGPEDVLERYWKESMSGGRCPKNVARSGGV